MFVLGNRDLRLPGLGSYLQNAANAGNTGAILWGLAFMIGTIVLMDQLIWRPIIAWSEKFKFEQMESTAAPHSPILDLLRQSKVLPLVSKWVTRPTGERVNLFFAKRCYANVAVPRQSDTSRRFAQILGVAALLGIGWAFVKMVILLATITRPEIRSIFLGAGATFLRVELTLVLAGLWTIPVGVLIGLNVRLSAIAQPIAQVAASVPATALFPIIASL
jgi:NitT/TauT family transport system permease protein